MKNKITLYFHCKQCLKNRLPSGQLAVGWTAKGIQVWCERCNKNVVSLDFLGQQIDYEVIEGIYKHNVVELNDLKKNSKSKISSLMDKYLEDVKRLERESPELFKNKNLLDKDKK